MAIKKVGIVSKPKKLEIGEIVPPLLEWLRQRDIEVCIDKETGAIIKNTEPCLTRNELAGSVELLIVLGGDGTLLARPGLCAASRCRFWLLIWVGWDS